MRLPDDTRFGRYNAFWLIDGEVLPKVNGRGCNIFGSPPISVVAAAKSVPIGAQTLTDVPARIKDMDAMEITTQVVFHTLFLAPVYEDVAYKTALCRAYNDFMGRAWKTSGGRLPWAAVLPIRDARAAAAEVRGSKPTTR